METSEIGISMASHSNSTPPPLDVPNIDPRVEARHLDPPLNMAGTDVGVVDTPIDPRVKSSLQSYSNKETFHSFHSHTYLSPLRTLLLSFLMGSGHLCIFLFFICILFIWVVF